MTKRTDVINSTRKELPLIFSMLMLAFYDGENSKDGICLSDVDFWIHELRGKLQEFDDRMELCSTARQDASNSPTKPL